MKCTLQCTVIINCYWKKNYVSVYFGTIIYLCEILHIAI